MEAMHDAARIPTRVGLMWRPCTMLLGFLLELFSCGGMHDAARIPTRVGLMWRPCTMLLGFLLELVSCGDHARCC